MGKKFHLSIENKLLNYKAVIKPIWSYGIELWDCTSKSNIVITQRSQSKILRAIAKAPWYVTNHNSAYRFQHLLPLSGWVVHERINKHHNKLEANPNPLIRATATTYKHLETKKVLAFRIIRHLRWHRWMMNTLPRYSNTRYRSVLCIIITLACRLYSFWLLIN